MYNATKFRDMLAEAALALNVQTDQVRHGNYNDKFGSLEFEQNGEHYLLRIEHLPKKENS